MKTRSWLSVAAFAIAMARALPVAAENAPSDGERFARGLAHYDRGEYVQAIELWEHLLASLGPTRGWRLLANLGHAYQAVGDATRAAESYEAFLRAFAARSADERAAADPARRDAEAALALIKRTYGGIRVERPARGIVLVRIGVEEPRPAGFTVYLKAGTHEVETFARTARARSRAIDLHAGETFVIGASELDDGDAAPPTPTKVVAPPGEPPRETASRAPLVVAGVATVLTAGLSTGLYLRAKSLRDDAHAMPRDDARYGAAVDEYTGARTLFYASLALPVVALGTTAVLFVTRREAKPTTAAGVVLERGGVVGTLGGRF